MTAKRRTYWIKLWVEMLGDPKVARLTDTQYRRFIEMLLLAGYHNNDGLLPSLVYMAWMLHLSEQEIANTLNEMIGLGFVHQEDGHYVVTNFSKRQAISDSGMRMRKKRERDEQHQQQVTRHSDVTSDASRSSSSSSSSSDSLINTNKNREVFRLYEQEIGTITKTISDELGEAIDIYPLEWFEPAFKEAARNNARKWNYIKAILKNWKANGFQSKNGRGTAQHGARRTGAIAAAKARLAAEEAAQHGDEE